jgi:cytidine deaminase
MNMKLDQRLVDAAIDLMNARYSRDEWAGAAAMYTQDGDLLTSIGADSPNPAASLCYETGCLCEAQKLGRAVAASVCVCRPANSEKILILTPCGICQERLFIWGPDVEVAVPDPQDPSRWLAKRLRDVQPYYWRNVLPPETEP